MIVFQWNDWLIRQQKDYCSVRWRQAKGFAPGNASQDYNMQLTMKFSSNAVALEAKERDACSSCASKMGSEASYILHHRGSELFFVCY